MGHTMISQRVIYKSSLICNIISANEDKGLIFVFRISLKEYFFLGYLFTADIFFVLMGTYLVCY